MTVLSVNINKIALIRNSRGGNNPNIIQIAKDCESFGAQGITVHPRPDERHVRYQDVFDLKNTISTELNVEGYPAEKFMQVVLAAKPAQVTLVPDAPDALTSNAGWDTITNFEFLNKIVNQLHQHQIRVSLFVDPNIDFVKAAKEIGADRVEFYTEPYAEEYAKNKDSAIENFIKASVYADAIGLEVNAGHDLNLDNLKFFYEKMPVLHEVSIGHALVCDSLYLGLEKTIKLYRKCLE